MAAFPVNSFGGKIATQLRQVSFNPLDIESNMYMGDEVVSMFAYDIKPSTWCQIAWKDICGSYDDRCHTFPISGREFSIAKAFDYILAIGLEAVFPQVTLANTESPVPYTISSSGGSSALYYYVSDGTLGLAAGTIYAGSLATLQSLTAGSMTAIIEPFVSHSPRHMVSWSQYALLAAIDRLRICVNGIDFQCFDRNALFNALQFRMREDVFPIAGEEATSFKATQIMAGVGSDSEAVLGTNDENGRYKAFTVPASFTTSALADRGQNGKHLSAFPLLLCCESAMYMEVKTINDLRKLLVFQEEVMEDNSHTPVVLVSQTQPTTPMIIGTSSQQSSIGINAFSALGTTGLYATSGAVTITNTPIVPLTNVMSSTASSTTTYSQLTLENLGAAFLSQTGVFLPVTRKSKSERACDEFDYSEWIEDRDLKLKLHAKVLGALVTDLERGMSKLDCRNRRFLYEAYVYSCEKRAHPGSEISLKIERAPGQFKYAYTFAENYTSRQQGQYFNFTNSTEFVVAADVNLLGTKFIFEGDDSIRHIETKIQGYEDMRGRSKFFTYVDNPLFAQRAPRVKGLHIVPRYANFINTIYPDGSINMEGTCDVKLHIRTEPSACFSNCNIFPILPIQTHRCKCVRSCKCTSAINTSEPNTSRYKVHSISVLWRMALFDLCV